MRDAPCVGDAHGADDFVVEVEREGAVLDHVLQEREDVLAEHHAGVEGNRARQVHRADDRHAVDVDHLARLREVAVAAALRRHVDQHGARLHAVHHVRRDDAWRGATRNLRGRDDQVLRGHVGSEGGQRLGLFLRRLLARVAAGCFGVRLGLGADERCAEREHLLACCRAHVVARDHRAETARGGDGHQPGHAGADDEGLGRRNVARGGREHRQQLRRVRRGDAAPPCSRPPSPATRGCPSTGRG